MAAEIGIGDYVADDGTDTTYRVAWISPDNQAWLTTATGEPTGRCVPLAELTKTRKPGMSDIQAGARRGFDSWWEGVLRDGDSVVWACGHMHENRDKPFDASGISAIGCAGTVAYGAEDPEAAKRYAAQYADPKARRWYLTAVERIRTLVGTEEP